MINNVVLVGRLTRDVELRSTQSGLSFARFNLAVDRNLSKEKRDEFTQKGMPTADFINIIVWGKMAEVCANYIGKGRLVAVSGRIQTGSYQGADGTRKYTTDVVADNVRFLDRGNEQNTRSPYEQSASSFYNQENKSQSSDFQAFEDESFYADDTSDSQIPF